MSQFGIYKARQQESDTSRVIPFYEKEWSIILLAIGLVTSIFSIGFYLGVGSVMNECAAGAGNWLAIISHHGDEIECRRPNDVQHESLKLREREA